MYVLLEFFDKKTWAQPYYNPIMNPLSWFMIKDKASAGDIN